MVWPCLSEPWPGVLLITVRASHQYPYLRLHTAPEAADTPQNLSSRRLSPWRPLGTGGRAFLRSPWVSREVGIFLP